MANKETLEKPSKSSVLYFIMCLTFAILCVFYVYFMCAAIGVIINDDDDKHNWT